MVSTMELVDAVRASMEVQVWDRASDMLKNIHIGKDITIIGCAAVCEGQQDAVKLNLWDFIACYEAAR